MNFTVKSFFRSLWIITICLIFTTAGTSQEEKKKPEKPVRNMFESIWLIDNQTVIVPFKGTFEFDIVHRFGTLENGYDDFFGLAASGNFRLGFNYVPIENLQVGFGFSKLNLLWDFNAKYAIIQQTRSGKIPLSLSYYVNAAIDTRKSEITPFPNGGDRFSYFHQLMVARKFSDRISLQASANLTHFNSVEAMIDENDETINNMKNDHFSVSVGGRLKIKEGLNFITNIDLPISSHEIGDPKSNLSFGIENVTSSHAFQIFVGNYYNILPQYNHFFNANEFGEGEILLGFNMTRLWNF